MVRGQTGAPRTRPAWPATSCASRIELARAASDVARARLDRGGRRWSARSVIAVSGSAAAGVAVGWLAGRFGAAVPSVALIVLAYAAEALLLAGAAAAVAA